MPVAKVVLILVFVSVVLSRKYDAVPTNFFVPQWNYNQAQIVFEEPLAVATTNHDRYKAEDGASSNSNYKDNEGFRTKEGFKSSHKHNVADNKKHLDKNQKGEYKKSGEQENSHEKHGDFYNLHHRGEKNTKAAKYGEKSGHKKGHKTKGYHNKFYRDEYHKEHKFYDDLHKSGHYDKEGSNLSNYENKSGNRKKSYKDQSGEKENSYGKKGHHKKGSNVGEHVGYNKKDGFRSHRGHLKNYDKGGNSSGGKEYGVYENE